MHHHLGLLHVRVHAPLVRVPLVGSVTLVLGWIALILGWVALVLGVDLLLVGIALVLHLLELVVVEVVGEGQVGVRHHLGGPIVLENVRHVVVSDQWEYDLL